jgi:hypothetical protein
LNSTRILTLSALIFSFCIGSAFSAPKHEIHGASNTSLSFGTKSYSTHFEIAGGYGHFISDELEIMGEAAFAHASGDTLFGLLAGPRLNFSPNGEGIMNAFFVGARLGLVHASIGSADSTSLGYGVEGGKRFQLIQNVAWIPRFAISSTTASNSPMVFSLTPVAFSFLF